jgi:hypothetical protein
MSTTAIRLINELEPENVGIECDAQEEDAESRRCQDEVQWTTKQVIAACLWSALFGLGCGYAWLLLQMATAGCQ